MKYACVCLTSKQAGCYQISLLFKTIDSDDIQLIGPPFISSAPFKHYVWASQSTGHNMYVQNRQKIHQYIKCVSERICHTWTVFPRLIYIDIIKHIYIKLNSYGENYAKKNMAFLQSHALYPSNVVCFLYTVQVSLRGNSQTKPSHTKVTVLCKVF